MFVLKGWETHPRSVIKAITYRMLGSIDTFVLGLIFSGSAKTASAIAGTEVFTKIALFYFHERLWALVHWGRSIDLTSRFGKVETHKRSFMKAVSWRIVGSIDTFVLGLIFSGSTKTAGAIAGTEVVTKVIIFYVHERLWSWSRWGQRAEGAQEAALPATTEPHPTTSAAGIA